MELLGKIKAQFAVRNIGNSAQLSSKVHVHRTRIGKLDWDKWLLVEKHVYMLIRTDDDCLICKST